MRREIRIHYLLLSFFGLAMGLMEAVIVVYLRSLFYPEGFSFPLKEMPPLILGSEILREACTIVMLVTISWIAGKNLLERFSFFLFSFSIWDLIYYLGLKLLLNWPDSLLTWDILFLIPVPWVGPVLAPVLCSIGMIFLSFGLSRLDTSQGVKAVRPHEWILLWSGAMILFGSFIWDFTVLIFRHPLVSPIQFPSWSPDFKAAVSAYHPSRFPWFAFGIGALSAGGGILSILLRTGKKLSPKQVA